MTTLALIICLSVQAQAGLLEKIARIESNNCPQAIGDKGRSLGMFQLSEAAWCDVSAVLNKQGLPTFDWQAGAHIPEVARDYAATYLSIVRADLRRAMKREPSNQELWAAWNLGVEGFRRCGFKLKNCPASTRRKAVGL